MTGNPEIAPRTDKTGHGRLLLVAGLGGLLYDIAAFFLPETKGKTPEEIEEYFEAEKLPARSCFPSCHRH